MTTIDIDFDVYKALTLRRTSEEVSYNDVLRELLGLSHSSKPVLGPVNSPTAGDWVTKGVRFPAGTEFRANYKGQLHVARVDGGALVVNGKRFDTPSSAAIYVTKNSVNGWIFWECRLPGKSSWQLITT